MAFNGPAGLRLPTRQPWVVGRRSTQSLGGTRAYLRGAKRARNINRSHARGVLMKLAIGIALGIGIGAAIGAALHQLAMGVALGAALGVAFGLIFGGERSRD